MRLSRPGQFGYPATRRTRLLQSRPILRCTLCSSTGAAEDWISLLRESAQEKRESIQAWKKQAESAMDMLASKEGDVRRLTSQLLAVKDELLAVKDELQLQEKTTQKLEEEVMWLRGHFDPRGGIELAADKYAVLHKLPGSTTTTLFKKMFANKEFQEMCKHICNKQICSDKQVSLKQVKKAQANLWSNASKWHHEGKGAIIDLRDERSRTFAETVVVAAVLEFNKVSYSVKNEEGKTMKESPFKCTCSGGDEAAACA